MKILHLADLHLGKKVNDFSMIKDQTFVLSQAIDLIKNNGIKAVIIAGDIFDRSVPPISALELFNNFLIELNKLNVKVLIISGNHDNMDRISYLSDLLMNSNIFISKIYDGEIKKVSLNNDIDVFLMPYLYPQMVRKYNPDSEIKTYNDSIKVVVDSIQLDSNKFNIMVAHQFVVGNNKLIQSDSEQKSVGGVDEIDYHVFNKFDYCALGHLHCCQSCGTDKIYYAGSILKYSFSEINQKKKFVVLDISENKKLKMEFYPIKPLFEMAHYRGYIEEFLDKKFYDTINKDDYIYFTLLDESVIDAKRKLSLIYPNIMLLDFDNSFTKNLNTIDNCNLSTQKTIFEHFEEFYKMQMNVELDDSKKTIVKDILNSSREVES